MIDRARQLPLDLPHEPSFAREDFLVAPANAEALRAIQDWPAWPGRMLLLSGPAGSGKSHLATIWARSARAITIEAEALSEAEPADLARSNAILIENVDRIGAAETNLFHLMNLVRENGHVMLLTARGAPDGWGLKKRDLHSRLRLAPVVTLGEPDEELARAVLFKLFSDRQLAVDPAVIAYIALRIDRSLGAARAVVEALDKEALARGKAVTRAMAAALLKDSESEG